MSLPWPLPVWPSEPKSSAFTDSTELEPARRLGEGLHELPRCAHRPDGMRARGPDADGEHVEDTE